MRCLRCGYPRDAHCRADGSCMWARCEAFVDKWPEEAAPKAPAEAPTPSAGPDADKE